MSDERKVPLREEIEDEILVQIAQLPLHKRFFRAVGWTVLSLLVLIGLLLLGLNWYTTTQDFQHRVGREVVEVLEDSTGGRVEVGRIDFSLWHLAIEVDGLIIHGKEAASELPYLSAAKILVRLKINTFLSHTVGKGPQSHIGLNFLRVEQPKFHLMIDANGNTNQPLPRKPSTSTEPLQNTLLDLQARDVELAQGLFVLNDKAVPFDLAANDLNAQVRYLPATDRYGAMIDLADLRTKLGPQPEVQSKIHLTAQIGRDMMSLDSFDFATGEKTHLSARGKVEHFNRPEWQMDLEGGVELKQLGMLANLPGFYAGVASLDMHGRNCTVEPEVAQKHHFWQRKKKKPVQPDLEMLPPSPDCKSGYLLQGHVKAKGVTYRIPEVRVHDVDLSSELRVTPAELLFTTITSTLPGGGRIEGGMKIENWLGEVPADAPAASATAVAAAKTANTTATGINAKPPVQSMALTKQPVNHAHAYISVTVADISLRTIMEIVAPEHYGDLGFDTSINGPVTVEWGGPVTNIGDSVQVEAKLGLRPTGRRERGYPSNLPLDGVVLAHYDGGAEIVRIQQLNVQTPQTRLDANGVLGVAVGDRLTNLQVGLQAHDLGEFDQLFRTLGLQANGKKGVAAVPVTLHGQLNFTGSAKGAVRNLDLKGHLDAQSLALNLGPTGNILIDSIDAEAEYSPDAGVAVASSTIRRNTAVLNVAGTVAPHRSVSRRGVASYSWDDQINANLDIKLANAKIEDALEMAGQREKVPVTGIINLNAHVSGQMQDFHGTGNVHLLGGSAYGESYQQVNVDFALNGQQIDATKLIVQAHDMQVVGTAGYNLQSRHVKAYLLGNNLKLSKFDLVQKASPQIDGLLSFRVNADGSLTEPHLDANLKLAQVQVQGKSVGEATVTASSVGSTVHYQLNATSLGAQLAATGTTSLLGNYQTEAQVALSNLDAANILSTFAPGTVKASSKIDGVVKVSGPLNQPEQLIGSAELTQCQMNIEGVQLSTPEHVHASLRAGTLTVDTLHIAGPDTDMQASGSMKIFGDNDPNGGALKAKAAGYLNMGLVHLFDPDYIASGRLTFEVAASGRWKKPGLTGNIRFNNVNLAMDGIPNGLSQMNGTMVFNEDRLNVDHLTAVSGGGKISLGGSILYNRGLFADLSLQSDTMRVRYAGLSATANSKLKLQGNLNSLMLSGDVLITRFSIGADVDFAAFAGAGGVQLPPDPTAPSNKVRLNVHVSSSPQLDFQNSYAKLAGSVDLNIRGTVAVPSILGRITITDGSATFAGTKYSLDRGTIYFSNPVRIDPLIDLDVSTRVENYDITIGVHGTMTNLTPTYRSSPPLTEADIFNLLALGRTQEEAALNTQQQQQAGTDPTSSAVLGGALNSTVSSRVNKLFGGGSVKIDPAFVGTLGNSSARITVEEPLSKQLTLVFATNINQSAQQLIQVQYQLTDNVSVVATRDESGVFSIVYKLRKRYK